MNLENSKSISNTKSLKAKLIILLLFFLGVLAIGFTTLSIQVQSGTSAYLAAVSVWSRGQLETVRQSEIFARTGDEQALQLARTHLQKPLGDLHARVSLESNDMDEELVYQGFLQGGNHPDDISRMVWLFQFFQKAPYFRDAVKVWRDSDSLILSLGKTIDQLEKAHKSQPVDLVQLAQLQDHLTSTNQQLANLQTDFRQKMSLAGRTITLVLSVTTVMFFLLLAGIATFLVLRLTSLIRVSEAKFRYTFEKAAIGIAQLDEKGHILNANLALCGILNYQLKDLLNVQFEALIVREDRSTSQEQRKILDIGQQDSVSFKQRLLRSDDGLVWTKTTMSRFEWQHSNSQRYICILEDISEQHRLSEELSYQARHDSLTGLINRRAFEGYLQSALLKARSENFVHCLCFIDLDQFKVVNDTLGHFAGDQLLLQVTQLFTRHLRQSDLLARLGGDEFALILDCCEPEAAVKLAEKLRQSLAELPFAWEGRAFNIGCSIGIVPIMANSSDEAGLLQAADSACHMAKEQGRNRVLLAYQDDKELVARKEQMEWLERIRYAIDNDNLYLDAQKIIALDKTTKPHIEVLIRMVGDNNEIIPPSAFLPAAERFGIAHLVDRWVIQKVCSYLKAHPDALNNFNTCHINISGRSFDHEDFTEFTINKIIKCNIPANKLCFEITETAAIGNLVVVQTFMKKLQELGCSFALDDFGAGLSSFAYLKQFPVDYLKIDGAFVKNMATDNTDKAMVKAISDIGRTIGKKIIAEFVENQASLDSLKEMQVEFAQGFYLHRPQKLEEVLKVTD